MPPLRSSFTALLLICIVAFRCLGQENFQPLFNGRDLTGWVRVNTAASTWTVQDGMLVCSGKPVGEIRTDRMYQNFVLELEWRHMRPRGNAGIFVWADDITARGVPFHRSIEVQVLENAYGNTQGYTTHGDIFPIHGATMTPINGRGGSRAFPTESRSQPSPEWNHYRITCLDGSISLEVNGKLVTQGVEAVPRKGYICLESEGGIVHYRNIRIKQLPDTPIDPAHVAIADRGYRCLYLGIDLDNWRQDPANGDLWQPRNWKLAYRGHPESAASTLATSEQFGNFEFLFDVRFMEKRQGLNVHLRGTASATFTIGSEIKAKEYDLLPAEQWNRIQGAIVNNTLSLTVNGQQVAHRKQLHGLPNRGPLTFAPQTPLELANIYVKDAP